MRGKAVSAVSATGTVAAPHLCNVVTDRIEQAQRMCTALGPGHTSTAMWVAAAELGDALTLGQTLETQMSRLAIEQGITAEEWSAIKSGESDLAGSTAADTTART